MELQTLLSEQIERESEYLEDQEVGSEEYNASMKRLNILEDKLIDLEKIESEFAAKSKQAKIDSDRFELESTRFKIETEAKAKQIEDEKKDKRIKNILEGVKIGTSVILPIIGLVWITAAEKEITFCGALKGYASMFVPKKMI